MQRLTMTMLSLNVDNDLGHEIMKQVHKPQNALMHQKMQEQMIASVNPVITELIMEAISQGICQTEFPSEATEMILLYSNTAFDELANLGDSERLIKIEGFIYNVERLLGMDRGSMRQTILPIFSK